VLPRNGSSLPFLGDTDRERDGWMKDEILRA